MVRARARGTILLTLILAAGCIDPKDRRPGLWLSGDVAAAPVEDWTFTDDHDEVFIETRTPYGIPHSVTIVCAVLGGRLYVGARNPTTKRWVDYVDRNPEVRLGIGERIYEARLENVAEPAEREAAYRAYAAKYGWDLVPPDERPELRYFRVATGS